MVFFQKDFSTGYAKFPAAIFNHSWPLKFQAIAGPPLSIQHAFPLPKVCGDHMYNVWSARENDTEKMDFPVHCDMW